MVGATELRTRSATLADAAAIAAVYNEGIADRIATFETEPRSAGQTAEWFTGQQLVIFAEMEEMGPVAFAASFPYSARPCYAGIGELTLYVAREYRGCPVRDLGRANLPLRVERLDGARLPGHALPAAGAPRAHCNFLASVAGRRRLANVAAIPLCWRDLGRLS